MTAERIDYTTGEVVATMTEPEARRATERIRTALDRVSTAWQDLAERVADAYSRRADLALGYGSTSRPLPPRPAANWCRCCRRRA